MMGQKLYVSQEQVRVHLLMMIVSTLTCLYRNYTIGIVLHFMREQKSGKRTPVCVLSEELGWRNSRCKLYQ